MKPIDIYNAARVLDRVSRMTLEDAGRPEVVGSLAADAFKASLPLRLELTRHDFRIDPENNH
jgi:hypothetical protein